MKKAAVLGLALAAALAGGACKETNTNYCPDAVDFGFSCAAYDASLQDRPKPKDAVDAPEASDVDAAAVADATSDLTDAASERPICATQDMACAGDAGNLVCDLSDGGAMCVECTKSTHCTNALRPVCDTKAHACVECVGMGSECTFAAAKPACNVATQKCVECVGNATCGAGKPICETNLCRGCKTDAECPAPGICLDSGACAADAQTVYVDFNANGCAGADGTSAKPFCNPSESTAPLAVNKSVVIIRGPASGPLNFDAALGKTVTVVGRKNGAGESPSIPVVVLAGIRVTNGSVSVRDLNITGGTAASAKGVLASGANVNVTLRRLRIETGTGLGVQADLGATLVVDQSIVAGNAVGGLLVNGAAYTVTNSVFANNGYGVRFNAAKPPSVFAFNTVVGNAGNAATCDPTNMQNLVGSIIVGLVDSCVAVNSRTTAPSFDVARPYHLTAKLGCPAGDPAGAPSYDLDGDPRVAPLDCGADELP